MQDLVKKRAEFIGSLFVIYVEKSKDQDPDEKAQNYRLGARAFRPREAALLRGHHHPLLEGQGLRVFGDPHRVVLGAGLSEMGLGSACTRRTALRHCTRVAPSAWRGSPRQ